MKISIKRLDEAFKMEASDEDGHKIVMDGSQSIGGNNEGFSPMRMLLAAVGGCSAIDVIMILKKQRQQFDFFEVEVVGVSEKIEDYTLYREVDLHFILKGNVERSKVERAIQLSLDKYCSVAKTLAHTAKINFKLSLNQ
jgi:putative redox protein